ncbi:MAG: acetolactate synthase 3 regulatory subunit domain protein [Alphaproteobacteria bacterium]|nr:acetolactate synthase 3 regulatory subunit domain protein [Alphaproteobacteria bacterium]
MSHTLNIRIADREGALVRLIGLVERRGYEICAMDKSAGDAGIADITMQIAPRGGERRIDVLMRQVARLFDVHAIRQGMPAHIAAGTARPGGFQCRHPQ